MKIFTTKRIARAGIIAALYTVLTVALGSLAYGPFQIRPAEALCILPLFFPEAVVGLFIGCAVANIIGYGIWDVIFGSLTTLLAAICTYFIGRVIKNKPLSVILGGIPPVLFNAIFIPIIIILVDPELTMASYWVFFGSLLLTEAVWVYALGAPLYFALDKLKAKNPKFFDSGVVARETPNEELKEEKE